MFERCMPHQGALGLALIENILPGFFTEMAPYLGNPALQNIW